jgi:hypothetical protein
VKGVRQRSLDAPPVPEMYHPITAEPVGGGLYRTLRTSGDPNDALTAARRALLDMHPRLPISHAERLTDTVQRSLLIHRVSAWGAAAFGVFAHVWEGSCIIGGEGGPIHPPRIIRDHPTRVWAATGVYLKPHAWDLERGPSHCPRVLCTSPAS